MNIITDLAVWFLKEFCYVFSNTLTQISRLSAKPALKFNT